MYKKHLSKYDLQKHVTKLKKLSGYSHWNNLGSQAIQDITDRIECAYKLYFNAIKKKKKGSPPGFRKSKKYTSFTLKQAGYELTNKTIRISKRVYKFHCSRDIVGDIKTVTVKNLARCHKHIANQRKDYHFKLAHQLASLYSIIVVEDLSLKGMHRLWGRKVSDLGFASFLLVLNYVCSKIGSRLA